MNYVKAFRKLKHPHYQHPFFLVLKDILWVGLGTCILLIPLSVLVLVFINILK